MVHENIVNPKFVMAWLPLGVVLESDHKKVQHRVSHCRACVGAVRECGRTFSGLEIRCVGARGLSQVKFHVWDWDKLSMDDFMGFVNSRPIPRKHSPPPPFPSCASCSARTLGGGGEVSGSVQLRAVVPTAWPCETAWTCWPWQAALPASEVWAMKVGTHERYAWLPHPAGVDWPTHWNGCQVAHSHAVQIEA